MTYLPQQPPTQLDLATILSAYISARDKCIGLELNQMKELDQAIADVEELEEKLHDYHIDVMRIRKNYHPLISQRVTATTSRDEIQTLINNNFWFKTASADTAHTPPAPEASSGFQAVGPIPKTSCPVCNADIVLESGKGGDWQSICHGRVRAVPVPGTILHILDFDISQSNSDPSENSK